LRGYFVGLDLGKEQDFTALAVIEKTTSSLALRHLERYPLGTPYTRVADHVKGLLSTGPLLGAELVVDKTGVGTAVTDIFGERGLVYTAVTITSKGYKMHGSEAREISVPKSVLVASLEVPFHNGTLKVAKGLTGWDALREELLLFRRKQNKKTAHISYSHWRESDHDDLVLAAALACWRANFEARGWLLSRARPPWV
jgi:hypothetical protein